MGSEWFDGSDTQGCNFGGTVLGLHMPRIDAPIEYRPQRAKCSYCQQWGEEKSKCGSCGAPIDEAKYVPVELIGAKVEVEA